MGCLLEAVHQNDAKYLPTAEKKTQTVRMLSEPRRDWPYLSKSLTSKLTNYFWLIQQLKILNDIPDKLFAQCGPAIPVI